MEDTTPKPLRVEVRTFTGDAVDEWLFQIEKYFAHNRVSYDQWMMIVIFHMAGEALKWYQWLYATHQVSTWFRFAQDVRQRFDPSEYCKPEVMLNLPHQTGLQTSNSHPVKEVIDSLTPSPKLSQVQRNTVMLESVAEKGSAYADDEDDYYDVNGNSSSESGQIVSASTEPNVNFENIRSVSVDVTIESDGVENTMKLVSVGVVDWNDTLGFANSVCVLNCNRSKCSSDVCRNASMNWPTPFTMHLDLSDRLKHILPSKKEVRVLKPPAKPPDDIYNLHVDGLSIWWKISGVFTSSPHANHRKGGLISLAAATVGLTSEASQHLEQIIPHVHKAFTDQDSRVRYYACEALYNIAKVVRGDCIIFFNDIFNALCKLAADSDVNMQSAAHLLDRLVKDIVTESDQFSIEAIDSAISLLESGSGLNSKFSYLWCQRVLPAAKEVYLQDLPSCYSTGQHETHLQKALNAFHSMVKGPAVQRFSKKLEEECILIWKRGRQLCDAVSLTGKPCVHQRHDLNMDLPPSNAAVGSHSSGFVFLHACACGRSRFLRPDPFDFETANRSSLCPPECGKLLHGLQFPQISAGGDIKSAAWNLIRIGAASYYDPAKGLIQSGFCTSQKFLLSWIVFLEKPNYSKVAPVMIGSTVDSKVEGTPNIETEKDAAIQLYQREPEGIVNRRTSSMTDQANGKTINTVGELPNSTIRKPFSEVVAGSAALDTDFAPLKHSKHVWLGTGKGLEQRDVGNRSPVKVYTNSTSHDPQENLDSAGQNGNVNSSIKDKDNWPHLQMGSNAITSLKFPNIPLQ